MPTRVKAGRGLGAMLLVASVVACGMPAVAAPVNRSVGATSAVSPAPSSVGVAGAPIKDSQEYVVLRENREDLPMVTVGHPFAIADLDGDADPDVVQGLGKSLKWLGLNRTLLTEVPALASPVASIAVSSLQGDGVQDVIVSTAETGAIYVYRTTDGVLRRQGQTPHIWVSTEFTLPLKMGSDSKKELLGVTSSGIGYLYRLTTQGWFRLWRGPLTSEVPALGASGDVDGDGFDEVALVTSKGRLQLFKFQAAGFHLCSDSDLGDAGGRIAMGDIDSDGRSEIVAVNSQKVMTVLSWTTGELRVRSRYLLGDVSGPALLMADVDGDGRTEFVVGGRNAQLGLYRWEGTALHSLGKTTWTSDVVSATWHPSTGITLVDSSGHLSKVRLLRSDYVRIQVGDEEYSPAATPVIQDGRVYLSARDASALFGLTVTWDPARKLTVLGQGSVYFGLKSDSTDYYVGARKALDRLEAPPVTVGGRLFIPLKILHRLFGIQAEWKSDIRTVLVSASAR